MDFWHLDEDLQRLRGSLLEAAGIDAINLYADVLDEAVAKEGKDRNAGLYWSIWQPWVGEDEEHPNRAQLLLRTVRDDSLAYARRGRRELAEVEATLRRRGGVYERLADYVLAAAPADRKLLNAALLQEERWRARYMSGEFQYLVRAASGNLAKTAIDQIVRWVDHGPVEELETDRELRVWKYQRLDLLEGRLPNNLAAEVGAARAEFGVLGRPEERRAITARFVGPTSPMDKAALVALGPAGMVDFLQSWRPASGWAQPTPEGLGRELTAAIAENPGLIGQIARGAPMLHPTYVRAVLQGVRDAVQNERPVDWIDALGLARRAVESISAVEPLAPDPFDADIDWSASRRVAAWVVLTALERRSLTAAERGLAWDVAKQLLRDPEPDPAHEREYGYQNMDWPTLAINTTRPLAVHSAIVAVTEPSKDVLTRRVRREAMALLSERLDPLLDPSLAVRAVFGHRYPALLHSAPLWARRHRDAIFPLGKTEVERWWAAWAGYLMFNGPTPRLFSDLHAHYSAAILRSSEPDWRFQMEPARRLAEHLVIGVARGWLAMDRGLIAQLQDTYRGDLWKEVLAFAGRALKGEELANEQVQRLQALWLIRRELQNKVSEVDDIGEFGWWFASESVDPEWALENLQWVLDRGPLPRGAAWPAADRLADLAAEFPTRVARILIGLISQADEPWEVFALRSQIHLVLDRMAGKGDNVDKLRSEISSRLFTRWGLAEFADRH